MRWDHAPLSGARYALGVRQAGIYDFWRRLRRRRSDLVKYDAVAAQVGTRHWLPCRLEYVPINQIVGSVGRTNDFTREFLPRARVNRDRWQWVDAAFNGAVDLPPVELLRIGDVYFVNDGHHRISVAHVNGYQGIEAYVTPVETAVSLTPVDFRDDRWLVKTAPPEQADPVSTVPSLAPATIRPARWVTAGGLRVLAWLGNRLKTAPT